MHWKAFKCQHFYKNISKVSKPFRIHFVWPIFNNEITESALWKSPREYCKEDIVAEVFFVNSTVYYMWHNVEFEEYSTVDASLHPYEYFIVQVFKTFVMNVCGRFLIFSIRNLGFKLAKWSKKFVVFSIGLASLTVVNSNSISIGSLIVLIKFRITRSTSNYCYRFKVHFGLWEF